MTAIRDMNPRDRVDRADRSIVKCLRLIVFVFIFAALVLTAFALVEAGWLAWATVGIVVGSAVALALIILGVCFLLS